MSTGAIRRAAVAGQFYPRDPGELRAEVQALLAGPAAEAPAAKTKAIAIVAPHAGYMYSGGVAGQTYARVQVPDRVVVLAVNHRGRGAPIAGWSAGSWETPLGSLAVDEEMAAAIAGRTGLVVDDPRGHDGEHSLEVQLPFLQVAAPSPPRITPISIAAHDLATLAELGHAVAAAIVALGEPVLLVASTDFTHYEDAASARRKDRIAIERILALDGPGLLATVLERRISMCGVAPTAAALIAASELGAQTATLVAYATSGDVTGDDASVVGYAGVLLN